ncbi:hypothetical protein JKP88DRAFT_254257, partial [Tribonema minus]
THSKGEPSSDEQSAPAVQLSKDGEGHAGATEQASDKSREATLSRVQSLAQLLDNTWWVSDFEVDDIVVKTKHGITLFVRWELAECAGSADKPHSAIQEPPPALFAQLFTLISVLLVQSGTTTDNYNTSIRQLVSKLVSQFLHQQGEATADNAAGLEEVLHGFLALYADAAALQRFIQTAHEKMQDANAKERPVLDAIINLEQLRSARDEQIKACQDGLNQASLRRGGPRNTRCKDTSADPPGPYAIEAHMGIPPTVYNGPPAAPPPAGLFLPTVFHSGPVAPQQWPQTAHGNQEYSLHFATLPTSFVPPAMSNYGTSADAGGYRAYRRPAVSAEQYDQHGGYHGMQLQPEEIYGQSNLQMHMTQPPTPAYSMQQSGSYAAAANTQSIP